MSLGQLRDIGRQPANQRALIVCSVRVNLEYLVAARFKDEHPRRNQELQSPVSTESVSAKRRLFVSEPAAPLALQSRSSRRWHCVTASRLLQSSSRAVLARLFPTCAPCVTAYGANCQHEPVTCLVRQLLQPARPTSPLTGAQLPARAWPHLARQRSSLRALRHCRPGDGTLRQMARMKRSPTPMASSAASSAATSTAKFTLAASMSVNVSAASSVTVESSV